MIISAGADAVEFALINLCHKGDIVVTHVIVPVIKVNTFKDK